jgi:hypothetical protein
MLSTAFWKNRIPPIKEAGIDVVLFKLMHIIYGVCTR